LNTDSELRLFIDIPKNIVNEMSLEESVFIKYTLLNYSNKSLKHKKTMLLINMKINKDIQTLDSNLYVNEIKYNKFYNEKYCIKI